MNAVNLIPADRRKRSVSVSLSPLTLGVIGGLVVVLIAAVLYVFAVNDVRARKTELASVTANAAGWQAAAGSYASYVTAAQQQKQQLTDIRQLVTGRFPWSLLLSQIGGVMPQDAALSSLQATSPSSATAASAAATGATGASTPTAQPITVAGCAASESAVAATMVALGRVQGVSSVQLASTNSTATSSKSASSSSSTSGGCPFPVSFSLSLVLASPSGTAAASTATTPTSTATTPATTPAASTATTPATGSAQ
jgi:Tfp pilus assembly protein PilN